MPDLMEGFDGGDGTASVDTQDGFDAALADKVGKGDDPAAGSAGNEPTAHADPAEDSAMSIGEALVADLLDPSSATDLASGLKVKEPTPEPTPPATEVILSDGNTYKVGDVDQAILRASEDAEELDLFRADEAITQLDTDVAEAEDESGFAQGLATLKQAWHEGRVSDEEFTSALQSSAIEFLGGDEGETFGNLDPEDQQTVTEFLGQMDYASNQILAARRVEDIDAQMPELIGKAADARAVEIQSVLTQWSRDQGLTDPGLREYRLRAAEEMYRQTHGGAELGDLFASTAATPELMYEALIRADGEVYTGLREIADRDFKARLLGADAGSLSEGLSFDGRPPVVQHTLPPIDPAKQAARTQALAGRQRYTSPSEIKRSFAPERSVSDGWTNAKGQPTTQGQIDGSKEAYAAEEKRRREASRY